MRMTAPNFSQNKQQLVILSHKCEMCAHVLPPAIPNGFGDNIPPAKSGTAFTNLWRPLLFVESWVHGYYTQEVPWLVT